MVLFSIVSLGSDVLSVASLSNSIPKLSCHVPTLMRRSDDRRLGDLTFSSPDLCSSTMSRVKSVLMPNWSNLTRPVRPRVSTSFM